jgi:hypothetical protein
MADNTASLNINSSSPLGGDGGVGIVNGEMPDRLRGAGKMQPGIEAAPSHTPPSLAACVDGTEHRRLAWMKAAAASMIAEMRRCWAEEGPADRIPPANEAVGKLKNKLFNAQTIALATV